jgi:hypothetical protein
MGLIAPSVVTLSPHHMEPNIIMSVNQASGFSRTLSGGNPRVQLGSEDKAVYIRTAQMRTTMVQNPATGNMVPNPNIFMGMIQCPTYNQRIRTEYDHHDTAMAGQWGIGLPEAYKLAMQQGHHLLLRDRCLYGALPGYGEGIVNTPGATSITLPPDTFGNTTSLAYDNGQMALFLLQQLLAIKTRTFQLGTPRRFTFLGPQRTLGIFEYNIVQLTSYQRPGAGTDSTLGALEKVAAEAGGDLIEWQYDDSLIGQGVGGGNNDLVILIMPEIDPHQKAAMDTNMFAKLSQGFNDNSLMYTDMVAPLEIPTPLPGGAIDVLTEMRASPGWVVRPEALQLITMPY